MSVHTSACRNTAGQIKEAGAHSAAGATGTSTQPGGVSHCNHPESTQAVDSPNPSTSSDGHTVRCLPVERLQHHPISQQIYGQADGNDLANSIAEHGVLEPLVVTCDNFVLSGHRRLAACRTIGLAEVPVVIVDPADDTAAIDLLLAANAQRIKTNEQLAREASARMKIEKEKARRRQAEAGSSKLPAKSPEAGDSRAVVGKQMGVGPKKIDQFVKVVDKLDELKTNGDSETHAAIAKALEKSANLASKKVDVLNERAKHQGQRRKVDSTVTDATEDKQEDNATIMARIQDDLVDGMEAWPVERSRAFEQALAEFRANWIATHGKEAE